MSDAVLFKKTSNCAAHSVALLSLGVFSSYFTAERGGKGVTSKGRDVKREQVTPHSRRSEVLLDHR